MTLKSTNQCAPNIPCGFSNMADIDLFQDDSEDNVDDTYGFEDGLSENDENLSPLERLHQYLESDNIFNRQMAARSILDTLRSVCDDQDNFAAVLDCMAKLSTDIEPSVRSELMEQVPHIAVFCQENRQLLVNAIPAYILPMVVRYLNDSNTQVRKTSQAALLVLLEQGLVEKSDIEQQVVGVILELASPNSLDDYRTEAVALMSKMAPLLGRDITERLFLPRFCEMLTDPLFHVRKVCAANFGEVCSVVGVQNSEEILLPKFYNLCGDGVWGVRKACAECFMTISCACSLETRRQYLASLFVDLLSDQSRWVRMSAFQQLGPFISTFADPSLTGIFVAEDGSIVLNEKCAALEAASNGKGLDAESNSGRADNTSFLNEEMDVVLSESEEDGGGEGKTDGKLVLQFLDDQSVEELRAQHISEGHGEGEDGKEEKSGVLEDIQYIDSAIDSLSLDSEIADKSTVCGLQKSENCDIAVSHTASEDLETASVISHASSETEKASSDSEISGSKTPSVSASDGRVHVHLDNSSFNTFQYWRPPLPEVDIDFDIINGAPANIHVVAKVKDEEKHKVYSTHMDVIMTKEVDMTAPSLLASSPATQFSASGSHCREVDLGGVKIHTASVSTVCDADEMVSNLGSTNVMGMDPLAEYMGGSSMGYMDSDLVPHQDVDDVFLAQQQDIIPQSLLENYLGMVEPSRAQTVDTEITRHCAYNLPAVAYTLGRGNWHCIKHLYETLSQAMQWKVRRTLAFSIHEMALIEGEEITHRDLLPVFDGFLKDLDEVRIGVLKHLADFLKVLRPDVRIQYLAKVNDFMKTDNNRNWRFRQELAEQLVLLCELFEPRAIVHHICPLAVGLCMDKVAQVRNISFSLMSAVLRRVHEEREDKLLEAIGADLSERFAQNPRWSGRQIFCQMCQKVLEESTLPAPVFADIFLPALLALGKDPIPNVRLTLARFLTQRVLPIDYFTSWQNPHQEQLLAVMQALQSDKDRDVRYFAHLQPGEDCSAGFSQTYDTVPV